MSVTIMMPSTFDQAIREMCSEAVNQAVTALAAKHGFDAEEAMRDLGVGEIKLVRKRGPSPKKETEKSVKKQKTKDSGEPKPKRAKTGYLVYQAFARPETVAELTLLLDEGEKLKPQAVVKAIAAKWQALSGEERMDWMTKAKRESNVPQPSPAEDGGVAEDDAEDMTDDE